MKNSLYHLFDAKIMPIFYWNKFPMENISAINVFFNLERKSPAYSRFIHLYKMFKSLMQFAQISNAKCSN